MTTPLHQWVEGWHMILDEYSQGHNAVIRFTDAHFIGVWSPDDRAGKHDNDNDGPKSA